MGMGMGMYGWSLFVYTDGTRLTPQINGQSADWEGRGWEGGEIINDVE